MLGSAFFKTNIMKKLLLLFLLIPMLSIGQGFCDGTNVMTLENDITLSPNTSTTLYALYLNDYNVYMKNDSSLSVKNLYGSGAILPHNSNSGNNKPALSICNYTCDVTLPNQEDFSTWGVDDECDGTLSVEDFIHNQPNFKVTITITNTASQILYEGDYNQDLVNRYSKDDIGLIHYWMNGQIVHTDKNILKE